jgi:hypothetical protein
MKSSLPLSFCLIATIFTGTALAQTFTAQTSESAAATSSPVAYVYVSRPTHMDGFAASSSGKLTPVPGSPFPGISVDGTSVTKKFLFGSDVNLQDLYTFTIGSQGTIDKVSTIVGPNIQGGDCLDYGGPQIDYTGSTLYNVLYCGNVEMVMQAYKIGGSGQLQFLANTPVNVDFNPTVLGEPRFLGTNKYVYLPGCSSIVSFERENNGVLGNESVTQPLPKAKSSDEFYCALNLAGDPADHLAIAFQGRGPVYSTGIGPILLASYTADSHGNLTTKNTDETMLATDLDSNFIPAMSISPTGKLLAVAGGEAGFEIFHFNGSSPITHFSGLLHASEIFTEFGWDAADHLYALSFNKLHVYTVTPTSIKEAPDSPYSIPEARSVIVLSRK